MSYFPLHVYSGHSFLQSGLTLGKIVALAKKEGFAYASLTDIHTLSGLPEFDALCSKAGIKPLFGMDLEVEGNLLSAFILSEKGYQNAMALDLARSQGELSLEQVKAHAEGLQFVLAVEKSFLYASFREDPASLPTRLACFCKGLGEVYLGLPYLPEEKSFLSFIRSFAEKYPYPVLAYPHILYPKKEDAITLEILHAIDKGETLDHKASTGNNYYLSLEEASSFYLEKEIEAIDSLRKKCEGFVLKAKRGKLLKFLATDGDEKALLRKKAYEGLKAKRPFYDSRYEKRLEYELSIIEKMGYSSYFLLVADYVQFALEHKISVGPGRGSGAGSLVAYCLDIVTPDPIEHELLFERFLNPERQSMPDIDVDFADVRRDEVATYLQEKYGKQRVAHIITFQTLGAKAALRDVGRVFEYKNSDIDLIAKTIPAFGGGSLADNYRKNEKFRSLVDSDKYYLEIVSLAAKIEGLPRQGGIHPAGIVLNEDPLVSSVPVHDDPTWGYIAQYEMGYLESQGFLKMDLLGLRNLTLVDHCLALLKQKGIEEKAPRDLPYRDPKAISLIASGKVMGLFQLESPGMKRSIREVNPTSFEDVVAVIALFRPGPMANIPSFARRKQGKEKITYLCPEMAPILSSTYGIIVYQEQIMQILSAVAGFSYGQADVFRRAISKKDASKMAALKDDFIAGCQKKGHSQALAEKIYSLIYRFADYGFNKSHALSYGVLACQMAYLKSRYPLEFYCSILDGTPSGDSKFKELSSEIKKEGFRFFVPDVNHSENVFYPEENGIRFPLLSIKGINSSFCMDLVEERKAGGVFKDIFDFACRMKRFGLTTNTLVKLIDAGCFDSMNPNRESLRVSSDAILSYAEMLTGSSGNEVLLGLDFPRPVLAEIESDRLSDLLAEKASLGLMISGSLLFSKKEVIQEKGLLTIEGLRQKGFGKIAAILQKVKVVTTKSNTRLAFISVYDDDSEMDLVMFEETYNEAYPSLKEGNLVEIDCSKDKRREDSFIANSLKVL